MKVNLRREPRSRVDGIYSLCWQGERGETRSIQANGRDTSISGLCLLSPVALAPGLEVFVEGPGGSPQGYSFVRHCTGVRDGFHVGIELGEEARNSGRLPIPERVDYYEFLQISPKAGQETIHRVYRFMASRFHPDNPETGDIEKFLLLKQAYEALSDPEKRAAYDDSRQTHEAEPDPVFANGTFVNGIEGEINRRLAIVAILYNKRRTNPAEPGLSLWELERRMSLPREYLDFAVWYLKAKAYLTVADNSDLTLTATGVDFVEANAEKNATLDKLLHAGSRTATGSTGDRERRFEGGIFRLTAGERQD